MSVNPIGHMPRGRRSQLYGLEFRCDCEWEQCNEHFADLGGLQTHQLGHFKSRYEVAVHGNVTPHCGLCDIPLDLSDWDYWERHSHYHAWTIWLRVKGTQIQKINDWPSCLADPSSRNQVPELPTPFGCGWEYCEYRTNNISEFMVHVSKHPDEYTDSRYPPDAELKCLWENCTYVARRLKNLTSHLDSHVQGKRVGCPSCGLLLVNFGKFEDHLKRQQIQLVNKSSETVPTLHHSVQPVRCSRCQRLFATEKLLLTHMQRHVNTVKCPFCDMTVFDKTVLDRHILFRHTSEKPFACDQCDYRCKLACLLTRHVQLRHKKSSRLNKVIMDTDLDNQPSPTSTTPVLGPLAAAGALSLLNSADNGSSVLPEQTKRISYNPNTSICSRSVFQSARWIRCAQPGCRFRTTKRLGYFVHIGRKHPTLFQTQVTEAAAATRSDYPCLPGFYACHLCPVIKRRGFDLSKHLMRDHQLTRPSGHVRFTYAISDDGQYRLQRTRLDTVPVATALLGETVVNRLLTTTTTQPTSVAS
ncbi:Histone H4 transcription factor [Paragonimus skrjabini miyazakii]|uniref:Histone H4 transcription factor n=1 Tax=Paragonimus skrjabini miyazakii TaxID=59628 RepID=A0A8S9YXM1_9TREM|nr:Histone H4 transcription factor [Paragonimus skrjabini miyazakii]